MKKILLTAFLMVICNAMFAQSANLTVINNTDYVTDVVVYGWAPSSCSSTPCDRTYVTNPIHQIPYGWPPAVQTYGPNTPCNVSTSVGFSLNACSTPFCSSLPSDFQWTFATISIPMANGCFGVTTLKVGDGLIRCSSAPVVDGPYTSGCYYPTLKATWSPAAGSAMSDVTITIDEL